MMRKNTNYWEIEREKYKLNHEATAEIAPLKDGLSDF